jgi:small ligand-binding sensory domain FIST
MRAGAAISRDGSVSLAAPDAVKRALAQAGLARAGCLIVAATIEHVDESIELCAALRKHAGAGAQIVGGAASSVFVPGDADLEEGPALGILALERKGHVFSWSPDQPQELRAAAQRAGPGALGLVFADPAAPLQRLLAALLREAPAVNFAGGGATAECGLLLEDDVTDASAVGVIYPASGPAAGRVAVAQSHQAIGTPSLVTRSEGRSLFELDGKPAVEALSGLAELPGISEGALAFVALGVSPGAGEPFREDDFSSVALLGVDDDTGAIEVGSPIPEGHSVCFTLRDGMGARRTLEKTLSRMRTVARPSFGVYFDCASRGTTLYGVDGLDLRLIEKSLGQFPLLALRTSFEIGPLGQGVGLHLFTGVLGLGE